MSSASLLPDESASLFFLNLDLEHTGGPKELLRKHTSERICQKTKAKHFQKHGKEYCEWLHARRKILGPRERQCGYEDDEGSSPPSRFMLKNLSKPVYIFQDMGWEKGSGTGKNNDGMNAAIKVTKKQDRVGAAHSPPPEPLHPHSPNAISI